MLCSTVDIISLFDWRTVLVAQFGINGIVRGDIALVSRRKHTIFISMNCVNTNVCRLYEVGGRLFHKEVMC